MRTAVLWLALLATPALGMAQVRAIPAYPSNRVESLAKAIAQAEGFGIKGAIPTRYHNPGDLKSVPGVRYPGQLRIGKGQHIVFRSDADGWAAMRHQLDVVIQGRSTHYTLDMSINQVSHRYAKRWHNWARYVGRVLGVPPSITLREYLCGGDTPTVFVALSAKEIL